MRDLFASFTSPANSAGRRLVPSSAGSGGWSVQLGTAGSESEAIRNAQRLNMRYALALQGATIGVYEAKVQGAAIYRLRVVGLSEADATSLCAHMKSDGGDCLIGK